LVSERLTMAQLGARARAAAENLRAGAQEAFQRLKPYALASIHRNFDRARDPKTGQPWAPLKYRTGMILVKTGRMRASIRIVGRERSITAEAPVPYAGFHQHGTRTIPRRRFLGFARDDLRMMIGILAAEASKVKVIGAAVTTRGPA
jgi:phage gpG-like protein